MLYNNENVTRIGAGQFAVAYRSDENPDNVYLFVKDTELARECVMQVSRQNEDSNPHLPLMTIVEQAEKTNVYLTRYSDKLTKKKYPQAWEIAKRLRLHKENSRWQTPSNWHILCADIIEKARNDSAIPDSIVEALEHIESWASAYGSDYMFEFPARNLGVDSNGNLVLRDILFFASERDTSSR